MLYGVRIFQIIVYDVIELSTGHCDKHKDYGTVLADN